MSPTLFADRFLVADGQRAIDLATGLAVRLRVVSFSHRPQLQAWLERCAASMAPTWRGDGRDEGVNQVAPRLVDFGGVGKRYFEAIAARLLPAAPGGRGREARAAGPLGDARRALIERLCEVLDMGVSGRPRVLRLALGSRARNALLSLLARECRLRGYVPVQPSRLTGHVGQALPAGLPALLHGRHVVVLHQGGADPWPPAARLFVWLGLDNTRPHVLLLLSEGGSPRPVAPSRGGAPLAVCAREQAGAYGATADGAEASARLRPLRPTEGWGRVRLDPQPGRSRSPIEAALEASARGRHATAVRALRENLAMLVRRGDGASAAEAAGALGLLLLTRGKVAEAARSFEEARTLFDRAGLFVRSVNAALFVGLAWTDAGRWLEAEAAIRAGLAASGGAGDAGGLLFGGLALARCLLWQGRHREALDALPTTVLGPAGADRVSEGTPRPAGLVEPAATGRLDQGVARACLAARIAIGMDDLRAAGAAAAAAREQATVCGRPAELAAACSAMASVYAALGDVAILRAEVVEGLRAARAGHAPLRALRLRTILAEGLLRAGKSAEARPLVARLSCLDRAALPAVVRLPIERVLHPRGQVAGMGRAPSDAVSPPRDIVEAVVEIVGFCQAIEDEGALVRRVVGALRTRANAAVVACFGADDTGVAPIAAEGRDPVPREVAQRAVDAGLAIAPGATLSGLEAAVPVRLGGRVIGALASRWPADTPPAWSTSGAVFAAAAAALAPGVRAVLDRRAVPASHEGAGQEIVGTSAAMHRLRDEIARAARAPFNVLIEGESGSGKELVARAIHRLGPRRHHRMCAINCAALTDELLEAELFGHARGAFTGAMAERRGLFEEADGGTLVLDEVGELTPRAQAKLLRAVQEGEVRRLGENINRPVDVRILAASNRALRAAADSGAFRRDLLYRLDVIRIVVPPLRERIDDIPLLASHFWQQATSRLGSRATLSASTLGALARYDWPGNVRELQNVLAALAVSAGRRGSVGPDGLPAIIARDASMPRSATLDEARRLFESRFVRAALARAGGRRAEAARDLGVTRQGLAKLLRRLGITDASGAGGGEAG